MKYLTIFFLLATLAMIVTGIAGFFRRRSKRLTRQQSLQSGPSNAASVSSPPAPAPASTPAPATASAKSWAWLWWIPVILALVLMGWWAAKNLSTKSQLQSQVYQQAPTPLKPFKAIARLVEDRSVGVEVENRDDQGRAFDVKVRDGGRALYFVEIPQEFKGAAYFKGFIIRHYDGELRLRVNGTDFVHGHKGGGRFWKVFSFPASHLHPGTNCLVLSSPGEDITARRMEIEIEQ